MTETNANFEPTRSHRHFDFDAFDSLITQALKEEVVVESDILLEGSPDVVVYDGDELII